MVIYFEFISNMGCVYQTTRYMFSLDCILLHIEKRKKQH